MKLKLINLIENKGETSQWKCGNFSLGNLNLVVGINASGKSRALRAIDILAELLSKRTQLSMMPQAMDWHAEFVDGDSNDHYDYYLQTDKCKVIKEMLMRGTDLLLSRSPGEDATIRTYPDNKPVKFGPSEYELAVVSKRDKIQQPFLEPFYDWGARTYRVEFGRSFGQHILGLSGFGQMNVEQMDHDPQAIIAKFWLAKQKYPNFVETLKSDMGRIGYLLESIDLAPPTITSGPTGLMGLSLKEADLLSPTEQLGMSQGMFRACSLLILANYLTASGKIGCLLVDDIGEGLDYSRSAALIDVLTEKSKQSGFQIVMATNDRFIMNHVPLENWTVIRRRPGEARIFNYGNAKKQFDDFKFTGLNNFDFLATDFLSGTDAPTPE